MAAGRPLPKNPFASTPVAVWRERLASTNGDTEVRFQSLMALSLLLPPQEALGVVLNALGDADPDLRAPAAHWLERALRLNTVTADDLRHAGGESALQNAMDDSDPDVQLAAVLALVRLRPAAPELCRKVEDLVGREDIQPASVAALLRAARDGDIVPSSVIDRLPGWLASDDGDLREAAIMCLGEDASLAGRFVSNIVAALEDEEPVVREQAALALSHVRPLPKEVREALLVTEKDPDERVAEAARQTLSAAG